MPDTITLNDSQAVTEQQYLCDTCGNHHDPATSTGINPVFWRSPLIQVCPTCLTTHCFECDDCGENFHETSRNNGPEGSYLCGECFNNYFTCLGCNIVMHYDNHQGDGYCQDCYQDDDDGTLVHDYSYRPRPQFLGKGPHYMGVELEVEVSDGGVDNNAEAVLAALNNNTDGDENFVYLKHDGSISYGFEIVSHPASLEHHRTAWDKFFAEKTSTLRSHQTNNCGLHIHTSRDCLSELTIGKMLAFVNCASNAKFIQAVARRDSNTYSRLDPSKKVSSVKNGSNNRYEAINLQPRHTVEFRIFRGTLKKEDLMLALEFVQALVEFCKPGKHSVSDCVGTDAFFKFIQRQHPRKSVSAEKIQKLGINADVLNKRNGSASHPYPYLAKFCSDFAAKNKA